MFHLDDIRLQDHTFHGLLVFDAGDDEVWAVGGEDQVYAAVGRALIDAVRGQEDASELAPILGRQLTDFLMAAADPDQWDFGLFLFQIQ